MTATRTKSPRRYRRATLTAGRLEVFLAIAVVSVLLAALAKVLLPAPASWVVACCVLAAGLALALVDRDHEERAGR